MRIGKGVNREIIGEANLLVVRRGDGGRVYKCNGLNVGTGTMRSGRILGVFRERKS